MSTPGPTPQRAYRALCPNCGAPVEFASAASASAVCSFCRSTLVRDGEALRRIGVSAELFDDHSPLQLGASGRYQGVPFTLVGRLQYRYEGGTWNEWHALFDAGAGPGVTTMAPVAPRVGWLSEDNGAYVFAFDQPPPEGAPAQLTQMYAGERRSIGGQVWSVASVQRSSLLAAEGELPRPPRLQGEFTVVDLRNDRGEVATLDDAEASAPPQWSLGRSVTLSALVMQGLRQGGTEKTLGSRTLACPNCGASVSLTLASTQSVTCPQCKSVVDVSQGVGGDLTFYAQQNSGPGNLQPQIPLGRVGHLALGEEGALDWQVVGYQERCDLPDPDDDESQTFWREYLLYHRTAGFAFLVDAEDGWSWVKPMTGAPTAPGVRATWQGVSYQQRYRYKAKVTWVLGEFYWKVTRGEQAEVTDYDGPDGAVMSRERTANEVVWSLGKSLPAATIVQAFRLTPQEAKGIRSDAKPLGVSGRGLSQGVIILIVVIVVMLLMVRCSGGSSCDDTRKSFGESSAEYQQCMQRSRSSGSGGFVGSSGGSFGGFSSGGGGHK